MSLFSGEIVIDPLIRPRSPDDTVVIQGLGGQSVDVLQVQNSAGTSLLSVSKEGNTTVPGTLVLTGDLSITGGVSSGSQPTGVSNWPHTSATAGTDTTPVTDTQWVTSLFLPRNMTLTGVAYLVGSVGGTDKVYVVLYSSTGAVLANSSITADGATVGTAAQDQLVAFTSTYAAKGPLAYFVGVSIKSAASTARLRTVPAFTSNGILAGSVTQVHGTVGAITVPSTFTADKAPIIFVY